MRGIDKKNIIFQASIKLITEKGLNNFTMNNVCQEAGISKGGFIYHFPSKEALLNELNAYIIQFSMDLIQKEKANSDSFTEAYIKGCIKGYDRNEKRAYSALLNYYSEVDIKKTWESFYVEIKNNLLKEHSPEVVNLIILATDGMWLRNDVFSTEELKKSLQLLLEQINRPKET
jgi:AcrR family transcriptional regulator